VDRKRNLVDQLRKDVSLKVALQAGGLNKSTYFYQADKSGRNRVRSGRLLDLDLTKLLYKLKGYELTLGYRKLSKYLRVKYGVLYNHKKVYRHMKVLKLLQPRKIKPRTRPNTLLDRCPVQRSNQRWEADLTYVLHRGGRAYVFVIIDIYDKEVVGHCVSWRCRADEAVRSLDQAIRKRFGAELPSGLDLVVRVDRGCQYTAKEFEDFCLMKKIRLEFCAVKTPNDKPHIESFIACYKREEVYRNHYGNFLEVLDGFYRYAEWYSAWRPHGSLGNQSPAAFRSLEIGRQDSLVAANY